MRRPRTDSLNLCNMSFSSLEVLWDVSQALPLRWFWNSNVRAKTSMRCKLPHRSLVLPFVQPGFTQLQSILSRDVICDYNLDCPANCWMPKEAGGECAAGGCVGFSFCSTARTGGWVFKMPQDPDTICCSTGCVWAVFCARRPPLAFRRSGGS